jgi:hypothetical protein
MEDRGALSAALATGGKTDFSHAFGREQGDSLPLRDRR